MGYQLPEIFIRFCSQVVFFESQSSFRNSRTWVLKISLWFAIMLRQETKLCYRFQNTVTTKKKKKRKKLSLCPLHPLSSQIKCSSPLSKSLPNSWHKCWKSLPKTTFYSEAFICWMFSPYTDFKNYIISINSFKNQLEREKGKLFLQVFRG